MCRTTKGIQHHHVIQRSLGGDDAAYNVVCLCVHHHDMCDKHAPNQVVRDHWKKEFLDYLASDHCKSWEESNMKELEKLYQRKKE